MNITPLDIQQKRFRSVWRGVDPAEVESFLGLVSLEFERLQAELHALRDRVDRDRRVIDEHEAREASLKETLITAQRVTEDLVANARREADIVLGRAELEADRLLAGAQERLTEILVEISETKRQRALFLAQVRGVVDAHQKLLMDTEADEAGGLERNLAVMRRRDQRGDGVVDVEAQRRQQTR
jgi:cell division initiation protein